jgi:hypothetical protein
MGWRKQVRVLVVRRESKFWVQAYVDGRLAMSVQRGSMGIDSWDLLDDGDADDEQAHRVSTHLGDHYCCMGRPMDRSVMMMSTFLFVLLIFQQSTTHGKVTSKTALRQGSGAVQ